MGSDGSTMLPAPGSPGAPNYWIHETSGVLRPAVEAYLLGRGLTSEQMAALRAYFRQWIEAPVWMGPEVHRLRVMVDHIRTRKDVEAWINLAVQEGMDPL